MRIIDAVWEKRNLGVETKEIEFEDQDSIEEVQNCLRNIHAEYLVVKVPACRADITHLLYINQYEFVEDMLFFVSNLDIAECSGIMQRMYDAVSIKKADDDDVKEIFSEIRKGMFSTDRISLDSHFTEEVASERYVNWTLDELERGTELYCYCYKNRNVGFSGLSEVQNGVYISFLGGLFNEYRARGIGTITSIKICETVKKLGGRQLYSMVSSNNVDQIRSLIYNKYNMSKINHIFVKHEKRMA